MIYCLYKTVNNINGKFYIGVHSTEDMSFGTPEYIDNYCGSGKTLLKALKKYGRQGFTVIGLGYFLSEEDAYASEANLVTEDWLKVNKDITYNIVNGGGNPPKQTGNKWTESHYNSHKKLIEYKKSIGYDFSLPGKKAALTAIRNGINLNERQKRAAITYKLNGYDKSIQAKETYRKLKEQGQDFSAQGKQAHQTAIKYGHYKYIPRMTKEEYSRYSIQHKRSHFTEEQHNFLKNLKANLEIMYNKQGLSLREISVKMGFGESSLHRWAKKIGFVPYRKPWQYHKV